MKLVKAGIGGLLLTTIMGVQAAETSNNGYYGASWVSTAVEMTSNNVTEDANPRMVQGYWGKNITDYAAVETRLGIGVGTEHLSGETSVTVDHVLAVSLRLFTDEYKGFQTYGMAGYSTIRLTSTVRMQSEDEALVRVRSINNSEDGLILGVGASYKLSDSYKAVIEYTNLYGDTENSISEDVTGLSIGFEGVY